VRALVGRALETAVPDISMERVLSSSCQLSPELFEQPTTPRHHAPPPASYMKTDKSYLHLYPL